MLLKMTPSFTYSLALDGAVGLNTFSSLRFQPSFVFQNPLVKAFVALTSILIAENINVIYNILLSKLVVVCPLCPYSYIDPKDLFFLYKLRCFHLGNKIET